MSQRERVEGSEALLAAAEAQLSQAREALRDISERAGTYGYNPVEVADAALASLSQEATEPPSTK